MKTKILTIVLSVFSVFTFSQITVTDADLLGIGDVIYQAYDEMPSPSISPGNPGSNQTWDFSSLNATESESLEIISPVGTPFESNHPTANMCIETEESEYIYINKSSSGLSLVGFDDIPYPQLILPLPLTYGSSTSIGPSTILDSSMINMFVADSLALLFSLGQAQTIDSIKIVINATTDFNVDAYGSVILPMGTFECLRLKAEDITTTEYFAYCTDTLFGGIGSNWYAMNSTIFPSDVETNSSFQFWSNDPLAKFVLANFYLDSAGNVEEVEFLESSGVSSVSESNNTYFSVFPIPATYNVTITSESNDEVNTVLSDINGREVKRFEFINSITLNLEDLDKGTYILNLKTENGELVKKLIVE
tara:strand:- start:1600 stop:2688 length:1089 start_codon:yes stop_codon:yes gene_type:complete